MGMAAGQARLLHLTARTSDISYRQSAIADSKVGLARETSDAADRHARAINQRKLMWDANGSGTGVDLTYGLLMTPSTANLTSQYIVSDNYGRVVLSEDIRNTLGLAPNGNAGSLNLSNVDFLMQMMNISAADAAAYVNGYTAANGGTSVSSTGTPITTSYVPKSSVTDVQANEIAQSIQAFTDIFVGTPSYPANPCSLLAQSKLTTAYSKVCALSAIVDAKYQTLSQGQYPVGTEEHADLLQCEKEKNALDQQKLRLQYIIGLYSDRTLAGGGDWNNDGIFDQNDKDMTSNFIKSLLTGGMTTMTAANGNQGAYWVQKATGINLYLSGLGISGVSVGATGTGYSFNSSTCGPTVSLSQMLNAATTGSVPASASSTTGPTALSGQDTADFYLNLYNAIANNGWSTNQNITNRQYFQNGLTNGAFSIQKLGAGGSCSTLSIGDPSSPLFSVKDDEAIALEDARYEKEKNKINEKEVELDVEMKNLDAELASLNAMMDSIKGAVNKNIERTFKMFQNG